MRGIFVGVVVREINRVSLAWKRRSDHGAYGDERARERRRRGLRSIGDAGAVDQGFGDLIRDRSPPSALDHIERHGEMLYASGVEMLEKLFSGDDRPVGDDIVSDFGVEE